MKSMITDRTARTDEFANHLEVPVPDVVLVDGISQGLGNVNFGVMVRLNFSEIA